MKQHGILYTPGNIVAILEDRKTQTRRLVPIQPTSSETLIGAVEIKDGVWGWHYKNPDSDSEHYPNGVVELANVRPKYQVGDQLYIKEAHYLYGEWVPEGPTKTGNEKWRFICDPTKGVLHLDNPPKKVCRRKIEVGWFLRSPLFMPKWAARHWQEVTEVRVERASDISEADAEAEGMKKYVYEACGDHPRMYGYLSGLESQYAPAKVWAKEAFRELWASINGEKTWNNWVFAYNFKRIEKP